LQNAQEGDLCLGRKLTDFIEEKRASLGQLEATNAALQSPGESPFAYAKSTGGGKSELRRAVCRITSGT